MRRLWASSRGSELQRKAGRLNRAGCPPPCRHLCCLPTRASFCGNPDERGGQRSVFTPRWFPTLRVRHGDPYGPVYV